MRRTTVLAEMCGFDQDTCPRMQTFIEQLARKHQIDLSTAGVRLWLMLPGTNERLLIASLSGHRVGITHCAADVAELLICDTDLVLGIMETGWQPIELLHTDAAWVAYVQMMAATGEAQIYDDAGEVRLSSFAEQWASTLEQQRWLDQSQCLCV